MGFHWINGDLLTTDLDPAKPQVLVYAPDRHGGLHLAALEYVVFKDAWDAAHPGTMPSLFGEDFMETPAPNRYEIPAFYALHVWLYRYNPTGLFEPFNPRVSCGPGEARRLSSKGRRRPRFECTHDVRRRPDRPPIQLTATAPPIASRAPALAPRPSGPPGRVPSAGRPHDPTETDPLTLPARPRHRRRRRAVQRHPRPARGRDRRPRLLLGPVRRGRRPRSSRAST